MTRMVSLIVLGIFVALAGVLFYQVMIGYFVPVFFALVLTVTFRPVHAWFVQKCNGRDRVAAGFTTAAILLIVLTPLLAVLAKATAEAVAALGPTGDVQLNWTGMRLFVEKINASLDRNHIPWQLAPGDVERMISDALKYIAARTPGALGNLVFGGLVLIFSLYYFLADGREMLASMALLFPQTSNYQTQLLEEFEKVSRAIVSATLLSAVVQGVLAGIGYAVAGLPSVFLLMVLTALMSVVPLVGSMSVWGGCALWLYMEGNTTAGILLALYGAGIVSMSDNITKPLVLHGQSKLHPLWALLSVLGGMQALGPIGIFLGPLIVAFLQAGVKMFQQELTALDHPEKVKELVLTGLKPDGKA